MKNINKKREKERKAKCLLLSDRVEKQKPQCSWGLEGGCCKNCGAGPCRIISTTSATVRGICGATVDTIVARNLLRATAAGASSHADHAREIAVALLRIAEGRAPAYKIREEKKLRELAKMLGKKSNGNIKNVAKTVAYEALEDFRRQEGIFTKEEGTTLNWLRITATKERQKVWHKLGIIPINADLETSRALHATIMGNEADPDVLLLRILMNGLVDGYALHISTNLQDVLFGTPTLIKSESNLGVLKENYVNIAVHGHIPLLSEKIIEWAKKLDKEARKVGAAGINVVGVCCTGHEVLMRHGIPHAAHATEAEMAIATGALEAIVVDAQCIYPALQDIASCFHTKIITTMLARITGAIHIPFHIENANNTAKQIVLTAIGNFKKRKKNVLIPKEKRALYAGFSAETIIKMFSKLNPKDPLRPLLDNMENGNILGIAALVGCRNPKLRGEKFTEKLIIELLQNNILIVSTGCIAHAAAQEGFMLPEANKYAGKTLKNVLIAIGKANGLPSIPPVLHMGSCVDNSRIEVIVNAIANKLKVPIPRLPIVASSPEWVSEKAISIAIWILALGIAMHINPVPPLTASPIVVKALTKKLEKMTGGKVLFGTTPQDAAKVMIDNIKKKRKELKWSFVS